MVKRPGKPEEAPDPAPPTTAAARLDAVFGALGSEVRRTLLARLAAGEAPVADLAASVAVSWPAVSKHLRVLEEAGLVVRARAGRTHRIARDAAPLADALAWLAGQGVPAPEAGASAAAVTPAAAPPAAKAPPAGLEAFPAARALVATLAPAATVIAGALDPLVPSPGGPADYLAHVLRRRVAGRDDLRAELTSALDAYRTLEAASASPEGPAPADLEGLTAGASRLSWLAGHHPALADLGLLAHRPPAA
jgi:DNA-binding transcriptional ArsR family regulator